MHLLTIHPFCQFCMIILSSSVTKCKMYSYAFSYVYRNMSTKYNHFSFLSQEHVSSQSGRGLFQTGEYNDFISNVFLCRHKHFQGSPLKKCMLNEISVKTCLLLSDTFMKQTQVYFNCYDVSCSTKLCTRRLCTQGMCQ